jgi:hypothetical protein
MNALDRKIDSMIKEYDQYEQLKYCVSELLRVMTRSGVISFLKYADNLNKEAKK